MPGWLGVPMTNPMGMVYKKVVVFFKDFFCLKTPKIGEDGTILTNIFQMG